MAPPCAWTNAVLTRSNRDTILVQGSFLAHSVDRALRLPMAANTPLHPTVAGGAQSWFGSMAFGARG